MSALNMLGALVAVGVAGWFGYLRGLEKSDEDRRALATHDEVD